ncbi:MAG: hypothetical protein Q8S03_15135 [Brevundimonas sp.]|uniref:hypothetical protein n=1 Tax=Brevundimonas sp. TaxID=1871086 RepID=UPI00273489F1|nr:hypothetical protein [Brevundimonas sp.]MDP3406022.1 hypothetical protein [Brevundimonas sp.]
MEDLFASSRDLLDSADEHIEETIGYFGFMQADKWASLIQEIDPKTGDRLCKVRFSGPVPIRVATRIFNVATELRAALDHAVYSATVALSERKDPGQAKFPFGDTAADCEQDMMKGGAHIPPAIFKAIAALKPYKAGNPTLWRLNKLRNVKDHRKLIVPAPAAYIADAKVDGSNTAVIHIAERAGPEDDYIVARVSGGIPGTTTKLNVGLALHVAFSEPADLKGLDPLMFLINASRATREAVETIEQATIAALNRQTDV